MATRSELSRPTSRWRLPGALLLAVSLSAGASAQPVRGGPPPGPLPLFPADSWWNVDVSAAPVDPQSAAFLTYVGLTRGLHPDFGGDADTTPGIYGMVTVVVDGTEPLVPVAFDYADQSDPGAPGRPPGYPIPAAAKGETKWIEGGCPGSADTTAPPCDGDKHMLIVDRDNRLLFETWNTRCVPVGSPSCSWQAGSGAVFPLDSNARRPDGWTSADAAGLAVLPGLVRYDEAFGADPIRHAFRVTVLRTNWYVFPASHKACYDPCDSAALPLGARLRLKPSAQPTIPSGATPEEAAAVGRIVQAMKTYGLIVADNGSNMYVQGTHDTRWNNDVLNPAFGSLKTSDFEVVTRGWTPAVATSTPLLRLYTITPCRLLDTRNPSGAAGGPALTAGGERIFRATGTCGIPVTARAVSANVTAVVAGGAGAFTVFPGDGRPSATSVVSFRAGQTRATKTIVPLASSGSGTFGVASTAAAGATHLVIDADGYFQ